MNHGFRLTRQPDWAPSLHKAADRYEQAIRAVTNARYADEFNSALAEQKAAETAYRAEALALDHARRPDFYAGKI